MYTGYKGTTAAHFGAWLWRLLGKKDTKCIPGNSLRSVHGSLDFVRLDLCYFSYTLFSIRNVMVSSFLGMCLIRALTFSYEFLTHMLTNIVFNIMWQWELVLYIMKVSETW